MLMGACAFALPQNVDWLALLVAFAGAVIGTASVVAVHSEPSQKHAMHINAVASVFLVVYVATRIGPDAFKLRHGSMDHAYPVCCQAGNLHTLFPFVYCGAGFQVFGFWHATG
jgi:uncharacterized membrane protein YadS